MKFIECSNDKARGPGAGMMQPRHRGMQPLTSVQFLGYLKDFLAL